MRLAGKLLLRPPMRSLKAAFVALVTVSLLLGLALELGVAPGVAAPSGVHPSLRGKVHIRLSGGVSSGRFAMSGAVTDHGLWDERDGIYRYRTLFGERGTVTLKIGFFGGNPGDCQCNWRITAGTKAYAGLRGRGYEVGLYQGKFSPTTHLTMTGWVWR